MQKRNGHSFTPMLNIKSSQPNAKKAMVIALLQSKNFKKSSQTDENYGPSFTPMLKRIKFTAWCKTTMVIALLVCWKQ